ncbi:hypothetical protein P2W68_08385 [Chryseobacterium arthrosphaerae]|uniref:hypothetical protein n=1 Tax=Chryseobacterium arthrosphaerae TaxID=651561 RepID=UPI0023E2A856|nr:hypothetical protein [Chryseobacterium arthrosphaerae]WES99629.1 hypothetical protein P2W68_08385 [Chryseobacterium arthrosphaerae]
MTKFGRIEFLKVSQFREVVTESLFGKKTFFTNYTVLLTPGANTYFSKQVFSFLFRITGIAKFVVSKAFDREDLKSLKKRGGTEKPDE